MSLASCLQTNADLAKSLCGCPACILSLSEAFTACLFRGYITVHLLHRECGDWTVIVESSHNHLRAYSAYSLRMLGSTVTLAFKSSLLPVSDLVGVTLRQWRLLRVPQSQSTSVSGPLVSQKDDRDSLHSLDVLAFCMSSCWHGHATAGLSWARGKKAQQWLVGQVHPCQFVPAVQSRQPHILRHTIYHCPHLSFVCISLGTLLCRCHYSICLLGVR